MADLKTTDQESHENSVQACWVRLYDSCSEGKNTFQHHSTCSVRVHFVHMEGMWNHLRNLPSTPGLKDVDYLCCSMLPGTKLEHPVRPRSHNSYLRAPTMSPTGAEYGCKLVATPNKNKGGRRSAFDLCLWWRRGRVHWTQSRNGLGVIQRDGQLDAYRIGFNCHTFD